MSNGIVVQFATLAVIIGIGIFLVYAIFKMRKAYTDHRDQALRAISSIEEFHKIHPELISVLNRVESDGRALQGIAIQIESAVATLRDTAISSIKFAGDRQIEAIETLRDHLDSQEQELAKMVELLTQNLDDAPNTLPAFPSNNSHAESESKADRGDYLRLRKEIVTGDPGVRFAVLRDWMTLNWLAILRRASRGWSTPADLIANIPSYLEPEAEVYGDSVLVVGTRGHAERLAVPLRDTDPSSETHQWFESSGRPNGVRHRPAVLIGSNHHFQLISKGSAHEVVPGRTHI